MDRLESLQHLHKIGPCNLVIELPSVKKKIEDFAALRELHDDIHHGFGAVSFLPCAVLAGLDHRDHMWVADVLDELEFVLAHYFEAFSSAL